MNPLAALLARLAREGFRLEALGGHIAVRPKDRLTPELRDEIIRHRTDVLELLRIHGHNLLALFADAPTWPPPRGESGTPQSSQRGLFERRDDRIDGPLAVDAGP